MENEEITVKYVVKRAYCQCCRQKLPQIVKNDKNQFKIGKEDVIDWAEQETWKDASHDPEELACMVREFTHEIISFNAVSLSDSVSIEKSELDKVKDFVTQKVIA